MISGATATGGSPDGYPVFSLHGSAGCRLLVRAPEVINPDDPTTPPNHADWLVAHIRGASLVTSTNANGHGTGLLDPDSWRRAFYSWLVQGGEPAMP